MCGRSAGRRIGGARGASTVPETSGRIGRCPYSAYDAVPGDASSNDRARSGLVRLARIPGDEPGRAAANSVIPAAPNPDRHPRYHDRRDDPPDSDLW